MLFHKEMFLFALNSNVTLPKIKCNNNKCKGVDIILLRVAKDIEKGPIKYADLTAAVFFSV